MFVPRQPDFISQSLEHLPIYLEHLKQNNKTHISPHCREPNPKKVLQQICFRASLSDSLHSHPHVESFQLLLNYFFCVDLRHIWWEASLILDCRSLLGQTWSVDLRHIWQEATFCVDRLACQGALVLKQEILYDTCPTFLLDCIYWNCMGISPAQVC